MANGGMILFQVSPINKSNFDNWSVKMKALLRAQDTWDMVKTDFVVQEGVLTQCQREVFNESKKRDKEALFLIYQAVDEESFEKISSATTTKEACEKLQVCHKGSEQVRKVCIQTLTCAYELICMEESESMLDYFSRVLVIANQMKRDGEENKEVKVVEKILDTVSSKFEYITTTIKETKDLEVMSIEQLMGSLQAYDVNTLN